jgi:hypothetical protein
MIEGGGTRAKPLRCGRKKRRESRLRFVFEFAMKRILIQLDTDPQPSVFDRVVAVDAGVEELFSYGGVTVENVEPLVHGAMFTRGPADLKNTAIFVGGSDVAAGERLRAPANVLRPVRFGDDGLERVEHTAAAAFWRQANT